MTDSQGKARRTLVQINPDDSLPEVLTRLRGFAGKSIDLGIPDHSPILLTATEFRTLKDAAQRSQISLTLKTDDRLRIQLASMFDLIDGVTIARRGKDASQGGADLAATASGWKGSGETAAAEDNDPISVSRRRRTALEETRNEELQAGRTSRSKKSKDEAEPGSLDYLDKADSGGSSRARLLGRIVAILAVIVLIGGIYGWYYMPEVAISVTLREDQVAGELTYAVGVSDAGLPSDVQFRIDAEESTTDVQISISIPATGGVVEPDASASGNVILRNPTDAAIPVPAGTSLQNSLGVVVTTAADVEVPAASGEAPGEARVDVVAEAAGTVGNVEQGAMTGKIADLDVYFSNREAALSGGTDRQILEVTEEDITTLETTLADQIRRITAEGWTRQLPEGQNLVAPSVTAENPDYEIEQQVGDQVETVSLTGTVTATGLLYDQQSIEGELRTRFQEFLNPMVPGGFGLLSNTIELEEATVISEQPTAVIYRQSATAITQAIYEPSSQQNLLDMLAGNSYSSAETIVQAQEAFKTSSIEISPGFWPDRMPQTADRISITVQPGSEQQAEDQTEASPEASP
ncbi:MAG: hypothetical protein WKF81_00400 [Thermomicrobiales bacterium]